MKQVATSWFHRAKIAKDIAPPIMAIWCMSATCTQSFSHTNAMAYILALAIITKVHNHGVSVYHSATMAVYCRYHWPQYKHCEYGNNCSDYSNKFF